MHISEGVLSLPVIACGWGIAGAGVAIGLRRTPPQKISRVALISAALFIASLIRIPVPPVAIHLTLLGVAGVLLGWSAFPALIVALFLQAVLFQFGGILALGPNCAIMGCAAISAHYIYKALPKGGYTPISAFAAGFGAVIAGTVLICAALYFSNASFTNTVKLIFAANLILALVEGVITAFIVLFLNKALPGTSEGAA